ncbi:MAG: TetR/AcrR family transcriptional regulator [Proteobacteria bacterium]|nr:TetR/AcrR family transcriptional regulator [Pseudomonadota bacterium]
MNDVAETKPLSKSAMRRQRERELRYQTILSAAESLFAKEGYHNTSMERIADAAEVSVGAVYFYFKNKEDLLACLIDESGYCLRSVLGKAFLEATPDLEGFKKAGHAFFEDYCLNHSDKLAILFRESVGQSKIVEERRKNASERLIKDVRNALEKVCEGMNYEFKSNLASEIIAVSILGIYERVAYQYIFWQGNTDGLKAIGHDAVDFLIGGIKNLFREKECT